MQLLLAASTRWDKAGQGWTTHATADCGRHNCWLSALAASGCPPTHHSGWGSTSVDGTTELLALSVLAAWGSTHKKQQTPNKGESLPPPHKKLPIGRLAGQAA